MQVRGVELRWWESGADPDSAAGEVLCLHETGATSEQWRPFAEAVGEGARVLALDRRGWGRSGAPEPYVGTTVEEQAEDAAILIERSCRVPVLCVGAGLGAVAALHLLLRRSDLVRAAVLVEPPLLAFSQGSTQSIAADRETLVAAVGERGVGAAVELFEAGVLPGLAPGSERLRPLGEGARERPLSLLAELPAPSAWPLPMPQMRACRRPCALVSGQDTPAVLAQVAGGLAERLGDADQPTVLPVGGLPHVDGAEHLAALAADLLAG